MTWLAARGRYDKNLKKILLAAVIVTDGAAEASAMTTIDAARPGVSHDMLALRLGCELAKANCYDRVMLWPEQSAAAKSVCASVGPDGSDHFDTDVTVAQGVPGPDQARYLGTVMARIDEVLSGDGDAGAGDGDAGAGDGDIRAEELAGKVLSLYEDTPDGHGIRDADTVLADMMEHDGFEITGIGPEMIRIWQESRDRKSVEKLFQSFTGHGFLEYLKLCEEGTTRSGR